jgi:hypothetical protein
MTDAAPTKTKIVIVAGQRFPVPADTAIEPIRQQLLTMGFADVASAEVKHGKESDGTQTIEFVKRAGTKGSLGPAVLAAALARVPAASLDTGLLDLQARVGRLLGGELTFAEALDQDLAEALDLLAEDGGACSPSTQGDRLCARLDLPAVPAAVPAW